ncbi:MAG: hypothetical protein GEU26_12865 [Nitrososphaeraceae archaeon]|nr:hypothetical protein [Nitrososphaeraceae archaeon]
MQSRSRGLFVKFVNDQDVMIVKLVSPFEGFDREVKTMQGDLKPRPHYRMHVIGDFNYNTKHPLSNPRLELSIDDVRSLKDEDAKIWTTPFNAAQGIQREVDRGHSILQIRRDGVAKSTSTAYNVLYAMQIAEEDWQDLLPNLSKEDIAKLQSGEKWNEISEQELEALENLGGRED